MWDEVDWEDEYGLSLEAVKKIIAKAIQEQVSLILFFCSLRHVDCFNLDVSHLSFLCAINIHV